MYHAILSFPRLQVTFWTSAIFPKLYPCSVSLCLNTEIPS